jgi:hypothetical protein
LPPRASIAAVLTASVVEPAPPRQPNTTVSSPRGATGATTCTSAGVARGARGSCSITEYSSITGTNFCCTGVGGGLGAVGAGACACATGVRYDTVGITVSAGTNAGSLRGALPLRWSTRVAGSSW